MTYFAFVSQYFQDQSINIVGYDLYFAPFFMLLLDILYLNLLPHKTFLTFSLFQHRARLRHSEALHGLILLTCLLIIRVGLVWWPLQQTTVKGLTVPPP